MRGIVRKIILLISIIFLLLFVIFSINQTIQIVNIASQLSPLFGTIILWILLALYLILIISPVYLYYRLPKSLPAPPSDRSEEFTIYLEQLSRRLQKNTHLRGMPVSTRTEIEAGLNKLNQLATDIVKKHSATVFVTTAISQSGRLDTLTVLIAQIRMVWQIAYLFYQRPSLRDMLQLYSNVAATAFIAGEINDIDISRQVEPIVASVLGGSLTSALPGVNTVANIITNSLLTGAANAYLTLRVGAIAKKYCGLLVKEERQIIRRSASLEAAKMLSNIVMNSAGNISKAIVNAAVKSPGKISRSVIQSTWGKISGRPKSEPFIPDEM